MYDIIEVFLFDPDENTKLTVSCSGWYIRETRDSSPVFLENSCFKNEDDKRMIHIGFLVPKKYGVGDEISENLENWRTIDEPDTMLNIPNLADNYLYYTECVDMVDLGLDKFRYCRYFGFYKDGIYDKMLDKVKQNLVKKIEAAERKKRQRRFKK